jgi:SNF family Na+-dependent transporter
MESKKGVKLSVVLLCLMMLLAGFAVGINIGSQLFTEQPTFITSILLGIVVLGCIIIPYVNKKEKEKEKLNTNANGK